MKITLFKIILFLSLLFLPLFTYAQNEYYKDRIGLNVHWALAGFGKDDKYNLRLRESKTRWVREHFYTEVFLSEGRDAWLSRYDFVLKKYKENDINVVGMLAYAERERRFWPPYDENWKNFIRLVVSRYKNYVKVWEIWNEPDSPKYLILNNPQTYIPILVKAYTEIKQIDPKAIVLTGGLSWPNFDFAKELYEKSGKFDAFAFHIYSCGDYFASGNFSSIEGDLLRLKDLILKYNGGRKAWITEVGCSTNNHLSESQQKEYLEKIVPYLLDLGFIDKIFIYNIRNYEYGDPYEDNFGLLTSNLDPRQSWYWYKSILRGPYDKNRLFPNEEEAKARELKTNLEKYFGQGLIPVSASNWPTLVNSYIYGEYPIQAIVQAIRFGGKTVHPSIPYYLWKETKVYNEYINKNWTGGLIIYAYGKPRQLITFEQQKAQELKNLLSTRYDFSKLRIDINNWNLALKAYIYGGYPIEAIARMGRYPATTVHTEIPYEAWSQTGIYNEYINKSIY
jgi:hypothetical protein